jgi:hypothetical protein
VEDTPGGLGILVYSPLVLKSLSDFLPALKREGVHWFPASIRGYICNTPIDPTAITSSREQDEAIKRHRLDNHTASAYLIAMKRT